MRGKTPRKWTDAVRAEGVDSTDHGLQGSVVSEEHSRWWINLFMTSRRWQRESCRMLQVLARMFLSTVHLV